MDAEFINPDNEILKHRVAQRIARCKPQSLTTITQPSSQDYLIAEGVLAEIANIIAGSK